MTFRIGPVALSSPVLLAPMSGVTDQPFRRLVRRFGAGIVVSEMIAGAEMVRRPSSRIKRMTTDCAEEYPLVVQLAGADPGLMAEAARLNEDRGAAVIDINFGCSVKRVVNGQQAGSALMRDEALAARILSATVEAVSVPVTLKMRTGWDEGSRNAPRLARIAEACGIQMVTVHGRTRCQFFRDRADWAFIRRVKEAVCIPVVANGDVASVDDGRDILQRSGADGVMVGRGACGRPWFLDQVRRFLETGERRPDPPLGLQLATLLEHYESILEHYGRDKGVRIARKHIGWCIRGLPRAAAFRATVLRLDDPDEVKRRIERFYALHLDKEAA